MSHFDFNGIPDYSGGIYPPSMDNYITTDEIQNITMNEFHHNTNQEIRYHDTALTITEDSTRQRDKNYQQETTNDNINNLPPFSSFAMTSNNIIELNLMNPMNPINQEHGSTNTLENIVNKKQNTSHSEINKLEYITKVASKCAQNLTYHS